MNVIEGLRDRYTAKAKEYHEIADRTPPEGEARPESETNRLSALFTELTSLESEIGIAERKQSLDIEAIAKAATDDTGKSVDEQTNIAMTDAEAFVDWMRAKASNTQLNAKAAERMNVNPDTLAMLPRKPKMRTMPNGEIVAIDPYSSDGAGGYAVPDMVEPMLTSKLVHYSVMRRLCDVKTSMTGRKLTFVTEDDTGNVGEIVKPGNVDLPADASKRLADGSARGSVSGQGRSFGAVELNYNIFSSKRVSVDREFIQDTEVAGIVGDMATKLGIRIGRAEEMAFAHGNSASGIPGCDNVGYLETNAQTGATQFAAVAAAGQRPGSDGKSAGQTTVEMWSRALLTGMDESYWDSQTILVRAGTLADLWHLKDINGRPAYVPSLNAGEPGMFLSRPIYTQPQLAELDGTGGANIGIMFNPNSFKIRDVTGFEFKIVDSDTANVESYMMSYYGFARCGFAVVNEGGEDFVLIQAAA